MTLKVLCAGCSKEERQDAEAAVRKALAGAPSGSWTVSLVKVQRQWSVTLEGPGHRLNLTAPQGRIRESILDALRKESGSGAPAPARGGSAHGPARPPAPAAPVPVERRERHQCEKCGRGFYLFYAAAAGVSQERVAAACPHCWHTNHVMVAEEAAWNRDYRVEKAD
jgi:hypothetical protein